MSLSTNALTLLFVVYCVLYNVFLCVAFLVIQGRDRTGRRRPSGEPATNGQCPWPILTVMIPALDEERVLEKTVRQLLALPYPGRLEVLIVDDHSEDRTPEIAAELSATCGDVYTLRRDAERSRRGKGDALNHGFAYLRYRFPERDRGRWVIGLFDADGRAAEDDLFVEVGRAFLDPSVAAVQCGVRIRNRHNVLAALQDVEFATFSYITQMVRDRTSGAVALGGNGQFIRGSTLEQLGSEGPCWDDRALTEDLDIGTRVHLRGGRIRFIGRWVEQEGIESLRALLIQRHRWAWGTLQVFLHHLASGRLLRSPMPWIKKLDLHYYLSFWVVPFVVIATFALTLLHLVGALTVTNDFGTAFLLANSFGFVPLIVLGLARAGLPARRILYLVPLTVIYAYHWIPVLVSAWASILTRRRPHWTKTARYEYAPEATTQERAIQVKEGIR